MNKSKDMNKISDAVSHFYPEYYAVKENPLLNEAIVVLPDSGCPCPTPSRCGP